VVDPAFPWEMEHLRVEGLYSNAYAYTGSIGNYWSPGLPGLMGFVIAIISFEGLRPSGPEYR
jgi:hypothetical protein